MDHAPANPFRHANLRLLALLPEGLEAVPFLCECDDPSCFEEVRLSPPEFGQISAEGGFVALPGHPLGSARPAENA